MLKIPRRRFLAGLVGLIAAPAIVRAESLMPVRTPKWVTAWDLAAGDDRDGIYIMGERSDRNGIYIVGERSFDFMREAEDFLDPKAGDRIDGLDLRAGDRVLFKC